MPFCLFFSHVTDTYEPGILQKYIIEAFALALVSGTVALFAEGFNIWGGAEGVRDAIRFFGQNHRAAFIALIAVGYLVTLFYVAWKTVNLITKQ